MSLIGHPENDSALSRLRARILADFRDTRFTGPGFLRWTGIVILAFLAAALIMLYFLDWNELRGPIGRYASQRAGRAVRIDGDLTVKLFRWQPHVEVGGLYIGNPAWVGREPGAAITKAVVEFRLVPAIFGHWKLPLVELDQPQALVVRDVNGRTNWDNSGAGWRIPPINRFLVQGGHLEIDDAVRKLKFTGTISSAERIGADAGNAFQLLGDGTLNGNKFLADVHGGPLLNVDESKPYAFKADVTAGDTRAVLDGEITHPFHLDQFSATVDFTGKTLSDLYDLTGLAMPRTPPYRITAHLTRNQALYQLHQLAGVLGDTDLHGELTVDVAGIKPDLRGSLTSRVLDFSDMGALFGGGKYNPSQDAVLLPDTVLHVERLNQMNADVSYAADSIRSRDFPLRGLSTHIGLKDGVLELKPLSLGFAQGKLSGSLKIDAHNPMPVTSVDARVTGLHVEQFIKATEKPLSGELEARAVLTGRGNSVHKAAASANGTFTAVVPGGHIRNSLAEWMGIDVLNALLLSGNQADTGVRCAVAHFAAKDGVLSSEQFVLDTDPVLVQGDGNIDLGQETIAMRLQGKPKHFQLFRLRAPITVTGSLQHPDLGVNAGAVAVQGVIGVGLAAVNPLAAILAFIDPGLAKNADCAGLISTARGQGAPAAPPAKGK